VQYGAGVWVQNWSEYADLNEHNAAYVYYFDETRAPREIPVEKGITTRIAPALPINFGTSIRLNGYQVPRVTIKRGNPIVLILYWQALGKIDRDYTMFAHLIAPDGKIVAQYDSQPRKGKFPTMEWDPEHYAADSILLPVGSQVPLGGGYTIQVGWYDSLTQERLAVTDTHGARTADAISIESFSIVE